MNVIEKAKRDVKVNRYTEIGERFSLLVESEITNHDPKKKLIEWVVKRYE